MRIDHLAIWTQDLEKAKTFYMKYFNMKCSELYTNKKKQFTSYFLSFTEGAARLEIMHRSDISTSIEKHSTSFGLTHFSISVGNMNEVDKLTQQLRIDGYKIVGEPRTTGDGYYESVVEDCEGNWVEITE